MIQSRFSQQKHGTNRFHTDKTRNEKFYFSI